MPVITASITDKINIADVNTIPVMYKGPSFIMELHNIIVIQSSTSNEKEKHEERSHDRAAYIFT